MADDSVIFAHADGIGRLTLNKPEKKNALSLAMWRAIPERVAEAAAANVKVLIVAGAGDAFAAGADISEFAEVYATPESSAAYTHAVQTANVALERIPMPTIAMVRGPCVGGGCGLALACDLRFAEPGARFGITPGKLGLAYTLADTKRLADAVGLPRAKDVLFSGRLIAADEALRMGLCDRVVSADALEAETTAYARTLAENSGVSLRTMKAILGAIADGADADTPETARLYLDAFAGADFKEGYRAFLEKRKPRFL